MRKIAVSCGDLNGIGAEILIRSHEELIGKCLPIYCVHEEQLKQASKLLRLTMGDNYCFSPPDTRCHKIRPAQVDVEAGRYSFHSFKHALKLYEEKSVGAVLTLPISKTAWSQAGIKFSGHTDYLRRKYDSPGIMMLGGSELAVCLFTDHIPLKQVPENITEQQLTAFLQGVAASIKTERIPVLGVNPHAGEGGILGEEDAIISESIDKVNASLGKDLFFGPIPADSAFTSFNRQKYKFFVAMYHDQGLIPIKTLYFDESVNVTLNHFIKRISVDHGTAFNIAYSEKIPSCGSYLTAIDLLIKWLEKKKIT